MTDRITARGARISLAALTATLMALPMTVGAANAQDARTNRTVVTTEDGRSFTREETIRGRPGDRSGTVTWTGPDGQTATREYRRQFDRANGYRRQSTTTGPAGRSGSVDARVRCGDGACSREVDRRGFRGGRSRVDGFGERVAPGVFEGRRTVTGPRGRERTLRWRRVQE